MIMEKELIILSGIPCAGKTTWARDFIKHKQDGIVAYISKDKLRKEQYGDNYRHSRDKEKFIKLLERDLIDKYINHPTIQYIIVDNTHCKHKYFDYLIQTYGKKVRTSILFFDIPLRKAYYRNIIRYFKSSKWIPFRDMKKLYQNYKELDRYKYIDGIK